MAETETQPEIEPGIEPEAGGGTRAADGDGDGAPVRTDAPYRAHAVRGGGPRDGDRWHLNVRCLDDHPDRGEVDALVVTVSPRTPGDRFPAADLDRMLAQCGFGRDGDWSDDRSESEEDAGWSAPCRQADAGAAPPAPPVPG
ncbi:hypothetical protein V2S66_21070 [Streptomyces sp. V4-01]|uniref:Uncharacterized protein n=1 Tax=Actinacidiphila polyblastidii TaxID=3110430 RepID=A0ABU7PF63_9ACTN|nr:hypothetical protein [Streptomyces sp. V4-01]